MSEAKNRRDKKSRAFIQPGQIFYQFQKRMETPTREFSQIG